MRSPETPSSAPVRTVGCIGLGNMGSHVARNLLEAGFDVGVFDVRRSSLDPFEQRGARVATSPRDVADGVDVLTITVVDDAQVRDVLVGDHGALDALRPGASVIVHSTISPTTCRELGQLAASRGVDVVDAALSGGEGAARDGTLTLMIGGSDAAVGRCCTVFDAISARRFHVGALGSGQVAKLVNNTMALVNRVVATEALALAVAAGLDEDATLELVQSGTGGSWQIQHWRETQALAADSTTGPEGMDAMARKDLDLALRLAAELAVPLPVSARARDNTAGMFGDPRRRTTGQPSPA